MGQLHQLREHRPRVRVGSHYDGEEWARPPRLPAVVELRERRDERRAHAFALFVLGLGLGYCLGIGIPLP